MDIEKAQADISKWGRETFGPCNARKIAARMNVEMAELLVGFDKLQELERVRDTLDDWDSLQAVLECRKELGDECADIFIMLVQVSDALERSLNDSQNQKMVVNRNRVWATGANGKVQHVEPDHPAQIAKDIGKQIFPGFETDDAQFNQLATELNTVVHCVHEWNRHYELGRFFDKCNLCGTEKPFEGKR